MSTEVKDITKEAAIDTAAKELANHMREAYKNSYKGEPVTLICDLENADPVEIAYDNKIDAIKGLLDLNGVIRQDDMLKILHTLVEEFENDLKSR